METRLERTRAIFAGNLKRRMRELKMSQSDLARAIWKEDRKDSRGYPQPVNKDRVSAWFNGRVLPTPENLKKAAEALGVTPESLLPEPESGVGPPPSKQHYISRPDVAFRMVDGGVYAQIQCKISLTGAREMMAVLAKYIQDYEELRETYEPSDPNEKSSESWPMQVCVNAPKTWSGDER